MLTLHCWLLESRRSFGVCFFFVSRIPILIIYLSNVTTNKQNTVVSVCRRALLLADDCLRASFQFTQFVCTHTHIHSI